MIKRFLFAFAGILIILVDFSTSLYAEAEQVEVQASEESTDVKFEASETSATALPSNCPCTRKSILTFAEKLFSEGAYESALLEYLRYRHYFPEDSIIPHIEFRSGLCYERMGRLEIARQVYEGIARAVSFDNPLRYDAYYRYLLTFYLVGDYDGLNLHINALESSDSTYPTYLLEYLRGWAFFKQARFTEAESIFQAQAKIQSPITPSVNYILSKSKQARVLPHKNPVIAGAGSTILPGAGQAYIGRWGDAGFSFAFSLGGIGSSIYFWNRDRSFALLAGAFGLVMYIGNIYGAVVSAELFNRDTIVDFITKSENEVPHPPQELMKGNSGAQGI